MNDFAYSIDKQWHVQKNAIANWKIFIFWSSYSISDRKIRPISLKESISGYKYYSALKCIPNFLLFSINSILFDFSTSKELWPMRQCCLHTKEIGILHICYILLQIRTRNDIIELKYDYCYFLLMIAIFLSRLEKYVSFFTKTMYDKKWLAFVKSAKISIVSVR